MAEITLDEIDFKILKELDRDGEVNAEEISDELDISPSTVYYRMDKYREKGILKGRVAHLDAEKLGLGLTAITEVKSSYGPEYEEIAERLSNLSGVRSIYFMLGEMSFYVLSRVRDRNHLQDLIEDIINTEGVEDSVTHIALRTLKEEPRLLVNYDDDDLEELFTQRSSPS